MKRCMGVFHKSTAGGQTCRGDLRFNQSLAPYTSWRVGGPAERFYRPLDKDDLAAFLQGLPPHEPLFWLGLGSNLLVRDGGLRGTVIHTRGRLGALKKIQANAIYAEAGVPCAKVARFCSEQGLAGGEFLAGIPGTLGGALAMNAGAFGGETWALVDRVVTVDRAGACRVRTKEAFEIGYRSVRGPEGEWFLSAVLQLEPGDAAQSRAKIRRLLARRAATQPTQLPSCGSVFRNPPGDSAGRLIEASGLKGFSIGGACVSEKHANFIVNRGKASARDIEALILHVRREVERHQGITLECEVRIIGEENSKEHYG